MVVRKQKSPSPKSAEFISRAWKVGAIFLPVAASDFRCSFRRILLRSMSEAQMTRIYSPLLKEGFMG